MAGNRDVCEANAIWLHELPFLSLSRPERPVAQSRRQTQFRSVRQREYIRVSFPSIREESRREGYTQFDDAFAIVAFAKCQHGGPGRKGAGVDLPRKEARTSGGGEAIII